MKKERKYSLSQEDWQLIQAALSTVAILGEGNVAGKARTLIEKLKREN